MNRSRAFLCLMPLLAACGKSSDFSGPAPAGALQCALAHGQAAGYELIEGSVERRFLRLTQRIPPPPAAARPDLADVVLSRPDPVPVENQILVVETGDRLEIMLLGLNGAGVQVGPGSNAEDQARTILALCTIDPPVFPAAVPDPVGGDS